MAKVVANIDLSLRSAPRDAYIIYAIPVHDNLFVPHESFEKIYRGPVCRIYRYRCSTRLQTEGG